MGLVFAAFGVELFDGLDEVEDADASAFGGVVELVVGFGVDEAHVEGSVDLGA